MKHLRFIAAATATAFMAVHMATPATAAAPKPHAKVVGGVCQGTLSYITSSSMAGTSRDERQIGFSVRVKSPREIQIFNIQGTALLKPGNYLANPEGQRVAVMVSFYDHLNNYRNMNLKFDSDGSFYGSTSAITISTPGSDAVCVMLGMDCSAMMPAQSIEVSGICADGA